MPNKSATASESCGCARSESCLFPECVDYRTARIVSPFGIRRLRARFLCGAAAFRAAGSLGAPLDLRQRAAHLLLSLICVAHEPQDAVIVYSAQIVCGQSVLLEH